ncbi:PP2C family protein-serine/threonine phosphatase [Nocardioides hwasunensis]|uniref:Serine/threonine-protein phosphatase n=1 Tax=Nocardioides hwasunensis TaxID=397258 RepID=A0ABR8MDC0_9ACTN|nr:PP2C family serine/threonine-protein phosphatase [Nocardioides hwasunensis]MBD3913958.1 serine/threonine-protein phosphatase [Nocardioides hwasunensis]
MTNVDLHHGAATDVGLVRKINEDSFLVAPPVFVVADGMGGHSGGDVASQMVVEEFQRLADAYDPTRGAEQVADTFARAQARIVEFGNAHRALQPGWHAGTTAVVAVLVDDNGVAKWLLANLGDSRIYRIIEGRLEQISVDHSVVQELIDAGRITAEEAAVHPERHVITRALGSPEGIHPDFFLLPLGSVERLLLCSDGISGMIEDKEIGEILEGVADPRDAADQLVRAAVAAGGRDNATAIVVDVVGLVKDATYDSQRQLESLESKLGGRL